MRFMLSPLLLLCFLVLAIGLSLSYSESSTDRTPSPTSSAPPSGVATAQATPTGSALASDDPLPGMPPVLDPNDIYSETRPDKLSPVVRGFPSRLYVPNGLSDTVDVIDPETYLIIESFPAGEEPQHVVPSYDLKTLWVLNNKGNSLTQIDPSTGKKGETVQDDDTYK